MLIVLNHQRVSQGFLLKKTFKLDYLPFSQATVFTWISRKFEYFFMNLHHLSRALSGREIIKYLFELLWNA